MEEQEEENAAETEEEHKTKYTLPQRVFIYEAYVKNGSAKICRREFRKAFPNIPPPKKSRILRLANNFRTTGLLLDVKKIEGKHIKELEDEAEENKRRKVEVEVPSTLENSAIEDQNSVSEGAIEDISSLIKTEIKSEPNSSPEHETPSNGFEFVPLIKKEPKDAEEEASNSSSDQQSSAIQAPEWGLVEDTAVPSSTLTTPDALPYPCRHCGLCFKTYSHLKAHISEQHSQMVKCGQCDKEFATRTQLQRHEQQHATFKCIVCSQEFPSQARLTTHMRKNHVKREREEQQSNKAKKKKKK